MTKDEIKKHITDTDLFIARAEANVFLVDFYFQAYTRRTAVGVSIGPILAYADGRDCRQIGQERKYFTALEKLYRTFLRNPRKTESLFREHWELTRAMRRLWPGDEKLMSLSDRALLDLWREIIKIAIRHTELEAIGEDKGSIVEKIIIPEIMGRNGWPQQKTREIINVLSHPDSPAVFTREKILRLTIARELKRRKSIDRSSKPDRKLAALINRYLDDFFWMKSSFLQATVITEKMLIKDLLCFCKNRSKREIDSELKVIRRDLGALNRRRVVMAKNLRLSRDDRLDIDFIRFIIRWFDDRKVMMMVKMYYLMLLVYEIGRRSGLKKSEASSLYQSEIDRLCRGLKIDIREAINRSEKRFFAYHLGKRIAHFEGREALELWNMVRKKNEKAGPIKGTVACRGGRKRMGGVVRVVVNPEKSDFKKNEILVTSMTRVEFVPLMHKAKAVITDEGGIACHAAIVSRELNIPCVIGTKTATDFLTTGDTVAINLETGEIKKRN